MNIRNSQESWTDIVFSVHLTKKIICTMVVVVDAAQSSFSSMEPSSSSSADHPPATPQPLVAAGLNPSLVQHLEAGAFRNLCQHLQERGEAVQNIDLMTIGGFCRNCLAKVCVQ